MTLSRCCAALAAALLPLGCAQARPPAALSPATPLDADAPAASVDTVPVPASFRAALARGTRSPGGAPGPRYWQQRVRYQIQAELDPSTALLRGRERVVYHNRSPDTLRTMVLNLYQNVYSQGVPRNRYAPITGGITLQRVAVGGQELRSQPVSRISVTAPRADAPVGYAVQGTLARLVLPRPILPGDSTVLEAEWRYTVPPAPTFRTAWEDTLGARALQVAQWYPQIAVYDDLRGWDATPYLGDGEFYLEYGDFDVALTLPAGSLVGASGELQNPEEVLTPAALARLGRALEADSVVRVVTREDLRARTATRSGPGGRVTWRFRARDVRDFAFATSSGYVWDATRALIPDGSGGTRAVAVHALYRPGAPHWERAARFAQHSVAFHSRQIIPYLYPQITTAEGPIGGMEYPMLIFIGKPARELALYSVISHEIGHQWFPMMVGSDEAAYAWMDEGVTSFAEGLAVEDFFPNENGFTGETERYLEAAGTEREVPLMRHTDLVSPYGARTVAAYSKPAVALRALRSVLGAERFDAALRTYAREWLLKHPAPWDFFHTVERVAGRQLDWAWVPWWFGTGVLDQAVQRVEGAATGTATVTVANLGEVGMPTVVRGTTAAGQTVTAEVPLEQWTRGARSATVTLRAAGPIVRVELDPARVYPDVDPENDVWIAPGAR